MAEDGKVAIRNIRRDGNDKLKANKTISEDLRKSYEEDIQKLSKNKNIRSRQAADIFILNLR